MKFISNLLNSLSRSGKNLQSNRNPKESQKRNLPGMAFSPMGNPSMGNASQQLAYWQQMQQRQTALSLAQMRNLTGAGVHGELMAIPPAIDAKILESLKAAEPRKVTARMPDSVTPIVAWRAWGITLDNGELRLKALGQHSIWQPKKKLEAACARSNLVSHPAPAPHFSCECGVWCFKTLELLLPALEGYMVPVFGNVTIWGRIIETDKGFRAQYAYPKELWLLDKAHEQLGYIYGVPVRTA